MNIKVLRNFLLVFLIVFSPATISAAPSGLEGLELVSDGTMVKIGETATFMVVGHYTDGTTADLTGQAQWETNDATIADVAGGTVIGRDVGMATISATVDGHTAASDVLVLYKGDEAVLKATANADPGNIPLSFNPQDAKNSIYGERPAWFIDSTTHISTYGERKFPSDQYAGWQTLIDDVLLPMDPSWMVVYTGGPTRRYSPSELDRIQQVKTNGIKVVGYLAFPDYTTETSKDVQGLQDKMDYLLNDPNGPQLDGLYFDGWIKCWNWGNQYANPFFTEQDQKHIYDVVKDYGSRPDRVLIFANDIWYINDVGSKMLDSGQTWMFDYLDGVDWELYDEDLLGTDTTYKNYDNGWNIIHRTMTELQYPPRWTAGAGKLGYSGWENDINGYARTIQGQGFSVFWSDSGADDGSWDWATFYPNYYPLGYNFRPTSGVIQTGNTMTQTNDTTSQTSRSTTTMITADGNYTYLSDMNWTTATVGWAPTGDPLEPKRDLSIMGTPLALNTVTYEKGIGTHANSEITYVLDGNYSAFKADIGVDENRQDNKSSTVVFSVYGDGVELYRSGIMTPTTATESIDINVSGVQELVLSVNDTGDGISSDHGDWADAKLVKAVIEPASGTTTGEAQTNQMTTNTTQQTSGSTTAAGIHYTYLSDMNWTTATAGWAPKNDPLEPKKDQSIMGKVLNLNGVTYVKGIGTHANSDIAYVLDGNYSAFKADIGVDENRQDNKPSTVVFSVLGDGAELYRSGIMTPTTATESIDINVSGVQELVLRVDDAGDGIRSDHADWADAKLVNTAIGPAPVAQVAAVRGLPTEVVAYSPFTVTVQLDVDENNLPSGLIVKEQIPAGFEVTDSQGVYHNGTLKYILSGDQVMDMNLTYTLVGHSAGPSELTFAGEAVTLTGTFQTSGDQTVAYSQAVAVAGDANSDGVVSDLEVLQTIEDWKASLVQDSYLNAALAAWMVGN